MTFTEAVRKAFNNLNSQNGKPTVIFNDSLDMGGGPISVGWENVSLRHYHDSDKEYTLSTKEILSNKWMLYYELIKCPKCKKDIDDYDKKFCGNCGLNLSTAQKNIEKKMKNSL